MDGKEKGKINTRFKRYLFVIKVSFDLMPKELVAFWAIQDRLYTRITLWYFNRHKVLYL